MRQYSLRQTANRYFLLDNRGSYQEKKKRTYVIHKMIDALFCMGNVPTSWQALKSEHIHKLVEYWKKQHVKDATIMRYMTIIRNYLHDINCQIPNIDNKSLQLHRKKPKHQRLKWQCDLWESFSNMTPRIIMALQTQFGLTYSEAIHIKTGIHIKEHKLSLTREITFNSLDRMIPIRNEIQKNILSDLEKLTNRQSLVQFFSYKRVKLDWNQALIELGIPLKKSWRYLYARQMYQYLLPLLGNYQTCLVLQDELGIKSRNTLWAYLHE
ncbi:TPA: integrase [Legionella pneumophila]|nr:integrase [Legionella pneumophila]HDI4380923.1 integrase [Legionella pneumophila]HDI4384404.1 integrase [Legionella pneumophila]HDI4387316.1 integrase [Legionella pneumophila]HDI4399860.1 integrase [Legionella pneumophila]